MSKELPYFRFTAFEWMNGDISLEDYDVKGVFADICAYYWFKDCSITQSMLEKKFSNAVPILKKLIELDIIKKTDNDGFLEISFLNEQYDLLSESRKKRQNAGSKGGKQSSSNAKAKLKHSSSYKDKDNNKDKDKDKDKSKYSEFVFMKIDEYAKLITEHGEPNTKVFIGILNNYKGATGKKYKSDYLAILNWVIDKAKKEGKYISKPRLSA